MKLTQALVAAVVAVLILILAWWFFFRPAEEPAAVAPETPQGTVLLIPGYGGGTGQLSRLAGWLDEQGMQAEIIDIDDGEGDLREYAQLVETRAAELIAAGQPPPDLIGYSAGGVTARAAYSDQPELFRRVITLASPHQGTGVAVLGELVNACPTACKQLQPDSELLASFPEPQRPQDWLSIWSEDDETIRPPESSKIPGIKNYRIQSACDTRDIGHGEVPLDPQTLAAIDAFLVGAPLPTACVP